MGQKFKFRILLLLSLVTILFVNCEQDEVNSNELVTTQKQNNYKLRRVSFSQLRKNKKAFDKLVEARVQKNPSFEYRGVYNSDFGVFIDTTNIAFIENGDSHSYTFQIISEDIHKFENLILNYKDNGDYSAYISKYNLSQEQINKLIESGSLTNIPPTSIAEVNSTMSIPISGEGSDCVEIVTYSTNMCYNSQGNLMESNGELSNGCVGMSFPVEHMIMVIDADCMSGGGSGGYDGSGGDNGGYNPGGSGAGGIGGNTGGTGGTGGNTGGNTGNPPNDGGNSANPIDIVDDGNNPIVTSPVININKTEVKLLNSLTPAQNDWWNSPSTSQETKDAIINYLNENNDTQNQAEEAIDFVKELIDYCIQENNSQNSIDEIKNILDILDDGMINGEQVVVGPDIPITDMADYLDCFDTSQPATITIYADQPVSGEHTIITPSFNVGHAFISIKQGNKVASFGFYPQSSTGSIMPNPVTLDPTDFISTPGIFGNDQNHEYDVSLSIPISAAGLNNLINTVVNASNDNPYYNLGSANCTDIAILIFENQTSVNIPSSESPSPWNGQTPGTLGEVIRNMPTPTNGSKNTNGGNSPNNNCN